jgi:hypothetical protein
MPHIHISKPQHVDTKSESEVRLALALMRRAGEQKPYKEIGKVLRLVSRLFIDG